ncbi:uncharacterized protein LOC117118051 [Anneissia japonica]|uniref:uncharacterized protein LOC117118051 n=1 Tax=Anneissia japonica TaxID=1529436 RepID=UPI0014258386|nr:uncharacterized protein LOC117118051 [Anneissia japonica]
MAGVDMEELMDEYASERITQEMGDRLAKISARRIQEEIAKYVIWKLFPVEIHRVGSSQEGFPASACSDEDSMICNTMFPIVLWTSFPKKVGGNFVMAEKDANNPVYLSLKVVDKMCLDEDFRNIIDNNGYLKTSDFLKANFIKGIFPNLDTEMRQGPSTVKQLNAEFIDIRSEPIDTVYCLKCQSWPPFTSNFFAREKLNNWPSQKLLDKVKSLECHVVPVGCPGSESDIKWRLSFSIAERELITEMYEPYANCMFSLKSIKKNYIIFSDSEKPTPFCSYFIKTACLWMCETFPHREYSLMDLIRQILDWLIDCYQHKRLPHYFIPQQNMIGHLSRERCDIVRQKLTAVKTDLWRKVLLSIDSDTNYKYYSKFNFLGDRDSRVQEMGQRYRTFAELVTIGRLMNHPITTELITYQLRALRSRYNLNHNLIMEQWAGHDFYLYIETLTSHSQENILLALRIPENSILPIIEQIEELVPMGYAEMFKTRLYRFLGDVYTHLLVPFRNKGYDDLLDYRHAPLYYYDLGAKMVFPDNHSDHGIGSLVLEVQYHYLMGNYTELKMMCEPILAMAKNRRNTRLASIELCLEKPL